MSADPVRAAPRPITISGEVLCSTRPDSLAIAGTDNPKLFRVDLHGPKFTVSAGDLPAGSYCVEVAAAETYFTNRGSRVMSVFYGHQPLIQDLDLVAVAGRNRAYTLSAEVRHSGGPFELRFEASVNRAKFSAIRVLDSQGAIVAEIRADPRLATGKPPAKGK